jgi:hypothetical protein
VSLSRPLVLWTDEKDDFLEKFTSSVQGVRYQLYDSTSGSRLAPFEVSVADVECFVNHESTRQFLVLKLNMSPEVRPSKSQANEMKLSVLAATVDKVVMSFDCPPLYEVPILPIAQSNYRTQFIMFLLRGRICPANSINHSSRPCTTNSDY